MIMMLIEDSQCLLGYPLKNHVGILVCPKKWSTPKTGAFPITVRMTIFGCLVGQTYIHD